MKKYWTLALGALVVSAVLWACHSDSNTVVGTEPTPVPTIVPSPSPTATPVPGACTFTGIEVVGSVCYRCTNGIVGSVPCPSPTATATPVPVTPTPTPAPVQCTEEGKQWAIGTESGIQCFICHFGEILQEPCPGPVPPTPSPTPSGCVSPCMGPIRKV